ncbi:MAG: hypothetical protein A2X67_08460 [Ignavibacteria bacterium GWA2_55_11]|nr:MAG: hypothetical protein A2X67_08460 [Ignavibacteria bacterium GWA2_55_11]OGU44463.1 MAG: hypothetical protein A2X68_05125 [Ignavibacteria bacterium GWC2_56_12]OGU72249.1 MAG: hypothetical protein A3G43_09550 [Ignavibacteria bacterium RIFCSPLOWO2_12_FULL_56_21]
MQKGAPDSERNVLRPKPNFNFRFSELTPIFMYILRHAVGSVCRIVQLIIPIRRLEEMKYFLLKYAALILIVLPVQSQETTRIISF